MTNLLADLFEIGLEYCTLNSYRSAISALHERQPLVTSLMKRIGNSRPPTPRYNFTWDIEQVLKHISSLPPNNKLSLKHLSLKLVMLLVLAATNRESEIKNLDTKFLSFIKPQKPISSATRARWIKEMLKCSEINTDIFKGHSVRSASASKAKSLGFTTNDILRKSNWSGESTWQRFHNKEIWSKGQIFQESVLQTGTL